LAGAQFAGETLDCGVSVSWWLDQIRGVHDRRSRESESGASREAPP